MRSPLSRFSGARLSLLLVGIVVVGLAAAYVGRAVWWSVAETRAVFRPPKGPAPPVSDAGLPGAQAVSFPVAGVGSIRGWYVPSRNGAALALLHGTTATRSSLLPEARILAASGFGVLLYDSTGTGESEGPVLWGGPERAAASAAVDWLSAQEGSPIVGVLASSMGTIIAVPVARENARVKALVLEGAVADSEDQTRFELGSLGPVTWLPSIWAARADGFRFDDPQPRTVIPLLGALPIMFVHGDADATVPPAHAVELHAAVRGPKELWMIPGVRHGGYVEADPAAWRARVVPFLERHLLDP